MATQQRGTDERQPPLRPSRRGEENGSTEDRREVSGRFLTDFLRTLEGNGFPGFELLGDLPIRRGEQGEIAAPVDWDHFVEFMRRLGHAVGGPAEIERCAESMGPLAPRKALSGLAGLAAAPTTLYRAAAGWALRRAIPAVEARLEPGDGGRLEIHARIPDDLRACPELLHFAAGGARVLPRLIDLRDAVVHAEIGEREAHYRILVPPSRTVWSRVKRVVQTITSAGDVLRFLEMQQLELHAKNEALQRVNRELLASERRYRALAETAVDVLCEIDQHGRVLYVSPSVRQLIGYSPSQVLESHYRLWLPQQHQASAEAVFARLLALPEGRSTRRRVCLRSEGGESIEAELTARTYDADDADRRMVCILRATHAASSPAAIEPRSPAADLEDSARHQAMATQDTPAETTLGVDRAALEAVVARTLDRAPVRFRGEDGIDAPLGAYDPGEDKPARDDDPPSD